MSKTNAHETDWLEHEFQNLDVANIGDATGLRGSTAPGSYYVALCDGDPGETGDLATNELTLAQYGQYARVAVVRSAGGWTVSGNQVSNAAAVTFAEMTTGTGVTATHFAICRAGTIATDDAVRFAALTSPLAISANITPEFAIGALVVTED